MKKIFIATLFVSVLFLGVCGAAATETTSYNIYALGTSNGSVTISPSKALYAPGDLFTVTATPVAGYKLGAWTGNYPNIETVLPTITVLNMQAVGNYNFGATFIPEGSAPPAAGFTVEVIPPSNGTVTISPSKALYAPYEQFTVTATPAAGYRLVGWTGNFGSDVNFGSPIATVISMYATANRTLGAHFALGNPASPSLVLPSDLSGANAQTMLDIRSLLNNISASGGQVAVTGNITTGGQITSGDIIRAKILCVGGDENCTDDGMPPGGWCGYASWSSSIINIPFPSGGFPCKGHSTIAGDCPEGYMPFTVGSVLSGFSSCMKRPR